MLFDSTITVCKGGALLQRTYVAVDALLSDEAVEAACIEAFGKDFWPTINADKERHYARQYLRAAIRVSRGRAGGPARPAHPGCDCGFPDCPICSQKPASRHVKTGKEVGP